ncbi:MAG TPA: DUF1329 domain-containing protein [Myxococcota bacterium]|nr:DUF1329 domain-containing protein [Myxococcota bacterium]
MCRELRKTTGWWPAMLLVLVATTAWGGVSPEEAARLDADLTPMGAERGANADGTIPAWTGGITAPPPGYEPGARHLDPYAGDPILYTVTAADLDVRGHLLSDGQKALLKAYPDTWWLNVYPTHRSASFPTWVYEAVRANATRARLILDGKGSVADARVGPPFPIPHSGVEVIWNHNLRWRGARVERSEGIAAVTRLGRYRVVLLDQLLGLPYAAQRLDAFGKEYPNVLLALKAKVVAPSRLAGNASLTIEPIDQTNDPRKTWIYDRDLHRVFRNPWVAYDFPAQYSDNLRTVDDLWLFNGPPDRFEWELLGKREMLIPYNAYRLDAGDVGPTAILRQHHIEPDLARYELHRVWVVQGTLKPGAKHVYSRRVFYVDEDSWQIAVAESYDLQGRLWRVDEAHAIDFYDVPALCSALEVFHDLEQQRYLVNGLDNERHAWRFSEGSDPREFSPNALSYDVR